MHWRWTKPQVSQFTFTGSFKTRLLTAVDWPLYLFCSPVGLVLSQLEAVRLTEFGFCFLLFTTAVLETLRSPERDPTRTVRLGELQPPGMATSWCASYPGLSLGHTAGFLQQNVHSANEEIDKNMVWLSDCWSENKGRSGRGKSSSRTKFPLWSVLKGDLNSCMTDPLILPSCEQTGSG